MLPRGRVGRIVGTSQSSSRWLQRQAGDQYTRKAHEEGMISRSAYKLKELLQKHKEIRGSVVVELGAAPGGWTRITQRILPKARIIAIDIKEMEEIPNTTQLVLDFTSDDAPLVLAQALEGRKVDILLSDMAPAFSGQRSIDHLRLMSLADSALAFGVHALKIGGHFIIKISRGGLEHDFKKQVEFYFEKVHYSKPAASYKDSSEMYLVAKRFLGIDGKHDPEAHSIPKVSIANEMESPFGEMALQEVEEEVAEEGEEEISEMESPFGEMAQREVDEEVNKEVEEEVNEQVDEEMDEEVEEEAQQK